MLLDGAAASVRENGREPETGYRATRKGWKPPLRVILAQRWRRRRRKRCGDQKGICALCNEPQNLAFAFFILKMESSQRTSNTNLAVGYCSWLLFIIVFPISFFSIDDLFLVSLTSRYGAVHSVNTYRSSVNIRWSPKATRKSRRSVHREEGRKAIHQLFLRATRSVCYKSLVLPHTAANSFSEISAKYSGQETIRLD